MRRDDLVSSGGRTKWICNWLDGPRWSPERARGSGWPASSCWPGRAPRWSASHATAGNLAAAQESLASKGLSFEVQAVDLTDAEATTAAFEKIGVPDVLINCAGAARRTPVDELDSKALHAAMEAKYFTYMHATEAVVRGMAERGSGAIVNVVGQGGRAANPLHIGGGAANAALMLASVGYAKAYADRGVRVNVINPGLTRTGRVDEGLEAAVRATGRPKDELLTEMVAEIPMGRAA